jgi:hypothetical protein
MKVQISILTTIVFSLIFSQKMNAQVDSWEFNIGATARQYSILSDVQTGNDKNGWNYSPTVRLRVSIIWAEYSYIHKNWGDTLQQSRVNPSQWYWRKGQYHVASFGLQTDPDFTLGSTDLVAELAAGWTLMQTSAVVRNYLTPVNTVNVTSGFGHGPTFRVRFGGDSWRLEGGYTYLMMNSDNTLDGIEGGIKKDRAHVLHASLFFRISN